MKRIGIIFTLLCLFSGHLPFTSVSDIYAQPPNGLYWTNFGSGVIGRANLDGSNPNQSWITGWVDPAGIAVNANYVYYANLTPGTIGRANLDGSSPNQSFISGCDGVYDVTVDANYVYWTNYGFTSAIGRANMRRL